MKYFLNELTNEIFVFKLDGSEDAFIPMGLTPIAKEAAQTIISSKLLKQENEANSRILSLEEIIYKRNTLLTLSDWTQLPDVAQTVKDKWVSYRQLLRDLTLQKDFPLNVIWPDKPI